MPDINIGEFSEALNNKMDLDGNNSNPPIAHMSDITGGIDISQLEQDILDLQNEVKKMLGRPDYSAGVSVSLTMSSGNYVTYTCPSDGYIYNVRWTNNANSKYFCINDSENLSSALDAFIPVSEGDILKGYCTVQSLGNYPCNCTFFPQR